MENLYHVLSRGVDKRKIFDSDQDYLRFIHNLFVFNDQQPINGRYLFKKLPIYDIARRNFAIKERLPRKLLVKIHCFCLMPNHYHLLLSPLIDGGISLFMKRVNMGYAKYFNQKYQRQGTLFQGRFKSILITQEAHFIHLPYYIHLNPLDINFGEWRERCLTDCKKATKFLDSYRWSSHLDYLSKNNFPSVTQRDFLDSFFGGPKNYKEAINQWLENLDLKSISTVSLE